MREEMPIYLARSFWLMLFATLIAVAKEFGLEAVLDENQLADHAMTIVPALLTIWAYLERIFGKKKLVFHKVRVQE